MFEKPGRETGGDRRCLVIRPTVTFGPRNFANMYSLIRQIAGGKFVFVGKANNYKSLSYVENIVDATFYLFDKQDSGDVKPYDVFNYVEKPDQTSRETAETIYKALGKPVPGWSIPMWAARILALPFDIIIALTGKNLAISSARLVKLFAAQTKFESDKVLAAGYKPKVPLPEGITRMVQWYEREGKDITPQWHLPPADVSKQAR